MQTRHRSTGPTVATRGALFQRSGGMCEMALPDCDYRATEVAHRISRKMGGRRGEALAKSNQLSNLIHACSACHRWTHAHPVEAQHFGLMLEEWMVPGEVSVLYRAEIRVLLDIEGTYREVES